jgi:hypothetical protein
MSRPILVTGAHRTGTTWIGKMLALAPGVGYIHEPFSPLTPVGISSAPFDQFYTRVTAENEALYLPGLERTLRFEYGFRSQLRTLRSPADAVRSIQDAIAFARARRTHARPLVKDPIALMSAEWLAERFGMDVVVTIRHPAAFATSVLRLGWAGSLDEAASSWQRLYSAVDGYRDRHADWTFVRHEDASRAPLQTFEGLYARLALELTPRACREIERHSAPENPAQPRARHGIRADSAANAEAWRTYLGADQVARLREATREVWPRFYSDDDW